MPVDQGQGGVSMTACFETCARAAGAFIPLGLCGKRARRAFGHTAASRTTNGASLGVRDPLW